MTGTTPFDQLDAAVSAVLAELPNRDSEALAAAVAMLTAALDALKSRGGISTGATEARQIEGVRAMVVTASRRVNRLNEAVARKKAFIAQTRGRAAQLTYSAPAHARSGR